MIAVRLRLKRAREAAGKSHEELGRLVGGRSTYWEVLRTIFPGKNGPIWPVTDLVFFVSGEFFPLGCRW